MRHSTFLLAAAIGFLLGLPTPGLASTVYGVAADGDLYTITLAAGTSPTTEVGSMGEVMTDIAGYDGSLYGVGINGDLYSINPSTGHATEIGPTGEFGITALEFDPADGVLYAAGGDQLYTINTSSGVASLVGSGSGSGAYFSSGDLAFVNGTLYLSSLGGRGGNDQLFSINPSTGQGTLVVGNLLHPDIFGLAEADDTLYGFSAGGQIVAINLSTDTASNFAIYSPGFYGVTSLDPPLDPPAPAPEPGTFGTIVAAMLGAGVGRAISQLNHRSTNPKVT